MKPYYEDESVKLFCGDCREVMKSLADNSVDAVVTDPPYELTTNKRGGTGAASLNLNSPAGRSRVTTGFMGQRWDGTGAPFDVDTWIECLRVLKPGAHLLAFGGSRTYHRLACAIEDAGFEIRDQIQWLYGSGFPKSLDVSKAVDGYFDVEREVVGQKESDPLRFKKFKEQDGNERRTFGNDITEATTWAAKQWNGWGTALKPAHEPIVLARKPLIGTVAENVLQHGTGGLNIDGCRIATSEVKEPSTTGGLKLGYHGGGNGFERHNGNGTSDPLGRWPANVIHDGSDEVLAGFPETHGAGNLNESYNEPLREYKTNSIYQGEFAKFPHNPNYYLNSGGSTARFFYCAKATQEDRNEGLEGASFREKYSDFGLAARIEHGEATHSRTNSQARRALNHHPTVKPTDLMRYLCRLITPPGGIVLDPFCGSGSTGKAAMLENFRFVGIELNADYCQLAQLRIEAVTRQGLLFA